MSLRLEWLLIGWTLLATGWWAVAIGFVWRQRRKSPAPSRSLSVPDERKLSIFKPIAALRGVTPPQQLITALESFLAELDGHSEILLGIEERDAVAWEPVLKKWRVDFPQADLKVIMRPRPARFLSPKISWFHALAEHASGELWLWSDSDILAPRGLISTMRREFSENQCGMLTCPYVIRETGSAPMMLEALFVNAEFYPGVLVCRAAGTVRFGLGAGMLFSAARFRERVKWEDLGARMADDNALGRALAPVRIGEAVVETRAAESNWRDAVHHYLRWQKTIRWCQPAGFAGQIVTVPALGWWLAILTHPASVVGWLGLVLTVQTEVLAATMLFWLAGSEMKSWRAVVFWSGLLRPLTWLACWTPWPVVFRSQNRKWLSLYQSVPLEGES